MEFCNCNDENVWAAVYPIINLALTCTIWWQKTMKDQEKQLKQLIKQLMLNWFLDKQHPQV